MISLLRSGDRDIRHLRNFRHRPLTSALSRQLHHVSSITSAPSQLSPVTGTSLPLCVSASRDIPGQCRYRCPTCPALASLHIVPLFSAPRMCALCKLGPDPLLTRSRFEYQLRHVCRDADGHLHAEFAEEKSQKATSDVFRRSALVVSQTALRLWLQIAPVRLPTPQLDIRPPAPRPSPLPPELPNRPARAREPSSSATHHPACVCPGICDLTAPPSWRLR